ncbi:MAG: IS481 family transposase [Actinobacteria bacterium]|nr:IS481 family transposase [Actinomycetota bacterium]
MDLARYVVHAVVLEGRSYREVARAHGVSKSWVAKVVSRFREGGYEAIEPRSRAPKRIPHRTPPELEDQIVALRKELSDLGVDAGAQTIHYHLGLTHQQVPSVSTIWRVLGRRGFVVPQPHKRPRSSWVRFEALLPNECWQSDVTHWRLADGTEVEIVNFLDDHSRVAVAAHVLRTATAPAVLEVFRQAAGRWGLPAALLTDNGCVYTTWHRGGPNVLQTELLALGIDYRHSRPYHPQTCGKIERFHQTLKAFLAKQDPAATIAELQAQVDRFVAYYNEIRPHRACGRRPPVVAFEARDKARPSGPKLEVGTGVRVRRDRIDTNGKVTLRYRSRLHHIGVGHAHKGKRVLLLVDGLDVRVLALDGELLRHLTLDPTRDYQPTGKPRASTMS